MKLSAGILPFKQDPDGIKVYLVHMGGPFWKKKKRSWSIVKGEVEEGEDLLQAATREFFEETGQRIDGDFFPLGDVKSSNKRIHAWAVEVEPSTEIRSNTFELEWPPKSGRVMQFPEVDRAAWFGLEEAKEVIVASQIPFLERLAELLRKN
ncbi:NUDIX domain-containing protein [Hydrogenimonas cancrithermarum]|uniref:NTP pyrophosphohydrolase n=1 Tax=Hydrogenimonas cancrithermarum TaxID=2993563 RepID=A0ABM8FID0_9BACT|nr:NUDIX domain-containing protein [Hydrogenimonas cancrithermarum]BDY12036.1 NTP pyrophosphohydrolase [Hydrogenimonas cancrithermarum]